VGPIVDLKSSLSYSEESVNGADVGVDLLLSFKNKVGGSAHISCNSVGLNRHQLMFLCKRATIMLENQNSFVRNFKINIYTDNGKHTIVSPNKYQDNEEKAKVELVKKIADRFVSACLKKQQMQPSMKEGWRVHQLIKIIKQKA
jgi:hypothetical protein